MMKNLEHTIIITKTKQKQKSVFFGSDFEYLSCSIFGNIYYQSSNIYITEEYIVSLSGNIKINSELFNVDDSEKNTLATIIEIYEKYGLKFTEKIEGNFSLIMLDMKQGKAYLFRDKVGMGSMYYYVDDKLIVVSSDLDIFMKNESIKKEVNSEILLYYFYNHYIPAPYTIYKNIYKLIAGEIIMLKYNYKKQIFKNTLADQYIQTPKDKKSNKNSIKKSIKNTIEKFVIEDINKNKRIGTFLSGGIDSSLITAISQSVSPNKITAFTIAFKEVEHNESIEAKKIASHLGVNHEILLIEEKDMYKQVLKTIDLYKEPFADSSQIATMCAFEFAKNKVDVIYNGDGADELFYGYSTYKNARIKQRLRYLIKPMSYIFKKFNYKIKNIFPSRLRNLLDNYDNALVAGFSINSKKAKTIRSMLLENSLKDAYIFDSLIEKSKRWDEKNVLFHLDNYLPDNLITKIKKPAALNSFDVRVPYLEEEIISLSNKIKIIDKYTYKYGNKSILKSLLNDYINLDYFKGPKKGFSVPLSKLIEEFLWDEILIWSSKDKIIEQNIFCYDNLKKILTNYKIGNSQDFNERDIFAYYVFQKWYYEKHSLCK